MILDTQLSMSDAQAVTATGDTPSTNIIDTGLGDSGAGEPLWLRVATKNAVTSGGAATVAIVLSDSADGTTFADVMIVTPAQLQAFYTANKEVVRARLPVGLRRYIRVTYRVATAVLTGGTFDADVLKDIQAQQYVPSAITVV